MKYQRTIDVYLNGERIDTIIVYVDPKRRRMEPTLVRVLPYFDLEELEFLRDEFVTAAMVDPLRPQFDDLECYDFADVVHDRIEIIKYGRVVSFDSVRDP